MVEAAGCYTFVCASLWYAAIKVTGGDKDKCAILLQFSCIVSMMLQLEYFWPLNAMAFTYYPIFLPVLSAAATWDDDPPAVKSTFQNYTRLNLKNKRVKLSNIISIISLKGEYFVFEWIEIGRFI